MHVNLLSRRRIYCVYLLNGIWTTSLLFNTWSAVGWRVQCIPNEEGLENHYSNTVQENIYTTGMRWCILNFTAVKHTDCVLSQTYPFYLQIWLKIKVVFGQAEVSRNITLLLEIWQLGLCSNHQWKSHFSFLSLLPSHSCLFGLQLAIQTWS